MDGFDEPLRRCELCRVTQWPCDNSDGDGDPVEDPDSGLDSEFWSGLYGMWSSWIDSIVFAGWYSTIFAAHEHHIQTTNVSTNHAVVCLNCVCLMTCRPWLLYTVFILIVDDLFVRTPYCTALRCISVIRMQDFAVGVQTSEVRLPTLILGSEQYTLLCKVHTQT